MNPWCASFLDLCTFASCLNIIGKEAKEKEIEIEIETEATETESYPSHRVHVVKVKWNAQIDR